MASLWQEAELYFWNILNRMGVSDLADILLVTMVVYWLLKMTRETRGSAVLKGLLLLLVVVGVSSLLGFTALNWLLMTVISNGALVLVILFQPELRKALEQIGRGARLDKGRSRDGADETTRMIDDIIKCFMNLSRRRVGALVVFEQKTGLQDVIENGIPLDAKITAGLLENIFEPNTPLHDGAVVVRDDRIAAAACILSLTESNNLSHDLGTRHRAALGMSETTDAVVLIVSEETGIISMARSGKLMRHLDAKSLANILESMYNPQKKRRFGTAIKRMKQRKEEKK